MCDKIEIKNKPARDIFSQQNHLVNALHLHNVCNEQMHQTQAHTHTPYLSQALQSIDSIL